MNGIELIAKIGNAIGDQGELESVPRPAKDTNPNINPPNRQFAAIHTHSFRVMASDIMMTSYCR